MCLRTTSGIGKGHRTLTPAKTLSQWEGSYGPAPTQSRQGRRRPPPTQSRQREQRGGHDVDIEKLQPGLSAEITTVVDDSLVVKHMGGEGVLSTPSMIGLMERAGIQAVQQLLPEGFTTVGFEVNVKHFAATPKGKKVTVRAELLEVDGRKLRFKVEAHDEDKKVGDGTHRRAVVQIQPRS